MDKTCPSCFGSPHKHVTKSVPCCHEKGCWSCHGSGYKTMPAIENCFTCSGSGRVRDNSTYSDKGTGSSCYLTTACCKFSGLTDDCSELNTLRIFRDNYLSNIKEGRRDIQEYYRISPKIVELINSSINRETIYRDILGEVRVIISLIDHGKLEEAHSSYKNMTLKLLPNYKI